MDNALQVKVKIGCNYEPKWFERRYTQGTYSAKNAPLDTDAMWLQDALIGKRYQRVWVSKIFMCAVCTAVGLYALWFYGMLP